jgi:hypothetical protein
VWILWKSGFHPTDTGKNGPRRLLEYMESAVWECCKSCPVFPILEDFSRKMGSGVVFHRISKGGSGGIFPQSGCFSDPAPVKNRLFQIVETGNFQNRKSRTRKAAFPYKGNISTKYPRKTNRFPQCIPHLVGNCRWHVERKTQTLFAKRVRTPKKSLKKII